jgi:tRNA (guanosine-2'-O-)-methyltransferase
VTAPGQRSSRRDLRHVRRSTGHQCWDHLIVAPLWVAYEANLGTLLRTCDAVGACMAVPNTDYYRRALARGNTLAITPHIHWTGRKEAWLEERRAMGDRIVGIELADDATRLADVEPARERTVVLLGHEHSGIPDEAWKHMDEVVTIPMIGTGNSLNVAVAGSLVLYKLAGLS